MSLNQGWGWWDQKVTFCFLKAIPGDSHLYSIGLFSAHLPPLDWKLHKDREFLPILSPHYMSSAWNSAWHITGTH